MTKMNNEFFKAPRIFTGITCPRRGSIIFQVLVALAQEAGLDFDELFDDEEYLIDKSLEWDMLRENGKSV